LEKIEVSYSDFLKETVRLLNDPGLLLVSVDGEGKPNAMAIGWGFIGILWSKPYFIVAVRPSRYTHQLIEETGDYTVNVPGKDMKDIVNYCGTVSGRDHDKFKEKKLTPVKGKAVKSPIIDECVINFECKVDYKTRLNPEALPAIVSRSYYPAGDYHTLYFGEILATYADREIAEKI